MQDKTPVMSKEYSKICTTRGNITAQDIQDNEDRMKSARNLEEPIKNIFLQIEEGVEYAKHGNVRLTKTQVLKIDYVIMAQAQIFKESCRDWRKLPQDDKTWPTFKTHSFQTY